MAEQTRHRISIIGPFFKATKGWYLNKLRMTSKSFTISVSILWKPKSSNQKPYLYATFFAEIFCCRSTHIIFFNKFFLDCIQTIFYFPGDLYVNEDIDSYLYM
jgi:hypothetical protein